MGVATVLISSHAKADGVILIKSHASQSPQFWRVFPFSKNEPSPYNYNVTLLNGQQQNFFRTEVGAIFEEPKWSELTITSDAEWQELEQQKSKLLDSLGQFPQLKNWSGSIAAKFDNLLDKNSSSVVVYKGRIISRDDYNRARDINGTDETNKHSIIIEDVIYKGIKITKVNNGRITILHNGGVLNLEAAGLKPETLSRLENMAPEKFANSKALQTNTIQDKKMDENEKSIVSDKSTAKQSPKITSIELFIEKKNPDPAPTPKKIAINDVNRASLNRDIEDIISTIGNQNIK
jgi:hypothetical protein